MEALAASDALLLKIFQGLLPYDEQRLMHYRTDELAMLSARQRRVPLQVAENICRLIFTLIK